MLMLSILLPIGAAAQTILPDEPPHAQLTFGPAANGVGFALKF